MVFLELGRKGVQWNSCARSYFLRQQNKVIIFSLVLEGMGLHKIVLKMSKNPMPPMEGGGGEVHNHPVPGEREQRFALFRTWSGIGSRAPLTFFQNKPFSIESGMFRRVPRCTSWGRKVDLLGCSGSGSPYSTIRSKILNGILHWKGVFKKPPGTGGASAVHAEFARLYTRLDLLGCARAPRLYTRLARMNE